ncbi:unnamed protein product [Ranitomeya imitator]|uniref:Reverse transcriptase/retrotransposon-derived protein RNase H-like domain-containing protein n=1 Tax=Ranitomeya imitator TaxID=111125 RepID=A0ABN9ME53_9NEOB|nr:unnamed protein product [Ranitomeya imitator]
MATPLTDLTKGKGSVMVKWTSAAEEVFHSLKRALCSQPVLVTPDFSSEFVVQTDASDTGVGAVLSQLANLGPSTPATAINKVMDNSPNKIPATPAVHLPAVHLPAVLIPAVLIPAVLIPAKVKEIYIAINEHVTPDFVPWIVPHLSANVL